MKSEPKLFISHASEDKDRFVRPLADALKDRFDVWYDEFELRLGDSLPTKIDEGLRSSDYGIVVLSPDFFSKKWPVSELNGLFALETSNQKLILPIWLNIGEDDVRNFSPILADRKAVAADKGIDVVVREIELAVQNSSRTQELFAPDEAQQALSLMQKRIASYELDQRILGSERGYQMFREAFSRIQESVCDQLCSVEIDGSPRFARSRSPQIETLHGPFGISLSIYYRDACLNTVRSTSIVGSISLSDGPFGRNGTTVVEELVWTLTCFSSSELGFRETTRENEVSEKEVVRKLVTRVSQRVVEQIRRTCD